MADVLPGPHRLVLAGGRGESEPVTATGLPGEQTGGITVGPRKPAPAAQTPATNPPEYALSVRGRVTDLEGRPAAGADVYAVCSSSGWINEGGGHKVLVGKTGADGVYLIPGVPAYGGPNDRPVHQVSVHLVAHQPGFGLAVGDGQSEAGRIPSRWQDIERDLVLPASHASLTVRVLREGKPCPHVPVALAASGENFTTTLVFPGQDRGTAAKALRALLAPSGSTGEDGTVRFNDLSPGLWDVDANRAAYFSRSSEVPPPPFNVSAGVAVQAGEDQSYTLSLLPPPPEVAFHFDGPDGLPLPAVPASMSVTSALYPNYGNIPLAPDKAGNGRGNFGALGLFQITAQVADRPLDINALAGPYYEGTALVAASAATASPRPIPVPTRRVGPAGIRVRLVDAQGKPLRGTVTVGDPFTSALYAASVGADGVAVFPDVPLSVFPYTVTAHIAGRPDRAMPGWDDSPLPSDAALIAGTGQPLPQTLHLRGGEETEVTFGPQPTGYVRLRLTGPFASAKGYYVEGRQSNDEAFTEAHLDPKNGEYLVGPLPPGRRTLHLFRYVPAPVATNLDAGDVTVRVEAGRVVRATLAARNTAAEGLLYSALLSGTVYLSDGKTPAWGARAALFPPDWSVPRLMARTDARGRLLLKDYWRSPARARIATAGDPRGPVIAAWLPGASGAVIVPFRPGRDLRLVLPPAIALRGRVTVGGRSVLGLPSQFRVRAAHQGAGRLNEALSVEASAQADGTFTLAGLTPGTYQVQAVRDDIWLSATRTVTVGAEALPEMTLDIAPPGVPVILSLRDRQGRPRPGREVKIVRPAGPLTEEIWPARLTSDDAGLLRVDGLEAGHHVLTLPGKAGEGLGFDVPAWTPMAPAMTHWIVLPFR